MIPLKSSAPLPKSVPTLNAPVKVLIVGNNPLDLGHIQNHLDKVRETTFNLEFAFSSTDGYQRAMKFVPDCILIDDSLSQKEMKVLVTTIRKNKSLKGIPLTLIKSSNYHSVPLSGFRDFLLRNSLTPSSLQRAIRSVLAKPNESFAVA